MIPSYDYTNQNQPALQQLVCRVAKESVGMTAKLDAGEAQNGRFWPILGLFRTPKLYTGSLATAPLHCLCDNKVGYWSRWLPRWTDNSSCSYSSETSVTICCGIIELAFQSDLATIVIRHRLDLACTSCQPAMWRRENLGLSTKKLDFTCQTRADEISSQHTTLIITRYYSDVRLI